MKIMEEKHSLQLCPIVFCQQVLWSELLSSGDSLPSLINVFDGIVDGIGEITPSGAYLAEIYLFAKAEALGNVEKNYEVLIEVSNPSNRRIASVKGHAEIKHIQMGNRVGEIVQPLTLLIFEDGYYLVTIKFQDEVIGTATLYINRNFVPDSNS